MSSTYEFFYFESHGIVLTSRLLLSLGGFEWKDKYPKNWAEEKPTTPLGKLPVLTEQRADGSTFVLAESNAINRYLARKAGLFGGNEDEAALVDQFYESWNEIVTKRRPIRQIKDSNPEKYAEDYPNYIETIVKPILAKHEQHLAKSGSNYYVGDKISLVDVAASVVIATQINNSGNAEITEHTYPHLWQLYQKVSSLDAVKAEASRFSVKK
ncbi:hypothetical protein BZG36_02541 [Bifiguratus adelaidae]|uniref:GST C-terminal domain-containing protein n=1 Tax=Bifiguratus adelaidae TaxID=1938954 RepID=A0A261Y2F9_9FUNG|nr:hypothetical protein BZG36_02541 [Bifiguratus adelaidae]